MTPEQIIQDQIHELEAQLAGKRLEQAVQRGHRIEADEQRVAMETAIRARVALRLLDGGAPCA
jgi:hypothetical protein